MLLLTQEAIEKINNISTEGIDAVVETRTHAPYQTMTFAELASWDAASVIEELNKAPLDYYNSLIDEQRLWLEERGPTIYNDEQLPRDDFGSIFYFDGSKRNSHGEQ